MGRHVLEGAASRRAFARCGAIRLAALAEDRQVKGPAGFTVGPWVDPASPFGYAAIERAMRLELTTFTVVLPKHPALKAGSPLKFPAWSFVPFAPTPKPPRRKTRR